MCAGRTSNQEQPATVTRATPSMLTQWLVSTTMSGQCFLSCILFSMAPGIQVCDQIGHISSVETRPSNALASHLLQHLGALMPQSRYHTPAPAIALPAWELRGAVGCVATACPPMLLVEY